MLTHCYVTKWKIVHSFFNSSVLFSLFNVPFRESTFFPHYMRACRIESENTRPTNADNQVSFCQYLALPRGSRHGVLHYHHRALQPAPLKPSGHNNYLRLVVASCLTQGNLNKCTACRTSTCRHHHKVVKAAFNALAAYGGQVEARHYSSEA